MKKRFLALAAVCMITMMTACSPSARVEQAERSFYAMDTIMSVSACGENAEQAVGQVTRRITELESLWSVTDEKSEIYALNRSGSGEVSSDTAELVSFALDISDRSGGALDPTIYPVLTAWGFTTGTNRVPSADELSELLKVVDYRAVETDGRTIYLKEGMMLDLGAVAKGAASDEAARILRKNCIGSALINLGGNIMTVGGKEDGSGWRIGVKDPLGEGNVGVLTLKDLAAVTSGCYERYFTAEDGTVYGHIIDPESGYPVDNELLSSTIISPSGRLCDALSTAVFVMGAERAEKLWRSWSAESFDMLLITKSGEVIVTEGAEERFELTDKELTLRVIEK